MTLYSYSIDFFDDVFFNYVQMIPEYLLPQLEDLDMVTFHGRHGFLI